jgi:hypothetical protein
MTNDGERDLRSQFQALRRDTALGTPAFGATLSGVTERRRRAARARRQVAAIALGATAAVLLFAVLAPHHKRAALVDLASVRWEAPTDFLLRTPGTELLRTVPTFTLEGRLEP